MRMVSPLRHLRPATVWQAGRNAATIAEGQGGSELLRHHGLPGWSASAKRRVRHVGPHHRQRARSSLTPRRLFGLRRLSLALTAQLLAMTAAGEQAREHADLILHHGKIVTLDARKFHRIGCWSFATERSWPWATSHWRARYQATRTHRPAWPACRCRDSTTRTRTSPVKRQREIDLDLRPFDSRVAGKGARQGDATRRGRVDHRVWLGRGQLRRAAIAKPG